MLQALRDAWVFQKKAGLGWEIMDVNRATELVTGVSRDQLVGSVFSDYFTEPESKEKANRSFEGCPIRSRCYLDAKQRRRDLCRPMTLGCMIVFALPMMMAMKS
jgi:hypothetical protein